MFGCIGFQGFDMRILVTNGWQALAKFVVIYS